MNRIMISERQQGFLFSKHYTCDYLDEKDEVFLFDKLIDSLDLSPIYSSYSAEGGKTYEPRDIFSLITYGFMKGITSSRKLEESTRYNIRFIHLAGNYKPTYRTILNFKTKHRAVIEQLFVSSIEHALKCGMIDYNDIFALDGTKLRAYASISKSKTKKAWGERRNKILVSVKAYLDECDRVDQEEDEVFGESDEKKQEVYEEVLSKLENLTHKKPFLDTNGESEESTKPDQAGTDKDNPNSGKSKKKPKERIPKIDSLAKASHALSECSKIDSLLESETSASTDKKLNMTDVTSNLMKSEDNIRPRYNGQVLSNNQLIVAADLLNEENDQDQLQSMVEQMKKNLSLDQDKPSEDIDQTHEKNKQEEKTITEESNRPASLPVDPDKPQDTPCTTEAEHTKQEIKLTGDAGYNAGENLEYLDKEENIDAYISMNRRDEDDLNADEKKFLKNNFNYDEDSDEWICPTGNRLENYGDKINNDRKETTYVCNLETCQKCPFFSLCVRTKEDLKKGYRTVTDDGCLIYRKEMKEKMSSEKAKLIYRKRSGEVEGIFGQMKYNKGITGFAYKGIKKFRAEFLMLCLSHNLGKIMRYNAKQEILVC